MRHLLRSVLAFSTLGLSIAAHADTFGGSATFTDTSSNNNNDYRFTGSFATSPFNFSGGVGFTYTDQLTITSMNVDCEGRCNGDSDYLSVAVAFTSPNHVTSGFSGTGSDSIGFTFFEGFVRTADIDWTTNSQIVSFTDGSSVQLSLPNFGFSAGWDDDSAFRGSEDLTIKVLSVPTAATPEPSSLMLLGSGLVGLGGAIRRKLSR